MDECSAGGRNNLCTARCRMFWTGSQTRIYDVQPGYRIQEIVKYFFIFLIRIYWTLLPATKRRRCIFKKSCSYYVYEHLMSAGAIRGIKAFFFRYETCRPGYSLYINPITANIEMVMITGDIVPEDEIAERLTALIKNNSVDQYNSVNREMRIAKKRIRLGLNMRKQSIFLGWLNLPRGPFLFLPIFFLFSVSCKKHSPEQIQKLDLTISKQLSNSVMSSERNPVQMPFHAKIVVKTKDTISRKAQLPSQSIATLRERLNIKSPKKLSNLGIQPTGANSILSASSFTMNQVGNYTATVDGMPGVNYGIDWYIVDVRTGNYSHFTTSNTLSIDFQISLPDYGYYFIYAYEPIYATEAFTNELLIGDPNSGVYPGAVYHNGLIELASSAAFENLLTQLDAAYEQHNADFFDSRDNMTDDQINDYAESINFDEFKPLRDFESYYGFQSLRKQRENEINVWFATGYNNLSTFPDNNYQIDEEIEQTLLTPDGKIMINGQQIQLNTSNAHTSDVYEDCINTDRKIEDEGFDSNTKIVRKKITFDGWKLFQTPEIYQRTAAKGKAISFKKKDNGNLKRYATRMSVIISGNVYNENNCQLKEAFIEQKNYLRRYRRYAREKWNANDLAWKHNEIRSDMVINGQTKFLIY